MKKILLVGAFILSSCGYHGQVSVVSPESLVNSSAEKVTFPIDGRDSLDDIVSWIEVGDRPSRAELSCNKSKICNKVKSVLRSKAIEVVTTGSESDDNYVSLIYSRLNASACFLKRLGCSTSLNSVRMVANREQFVEPFISDMQDASTAVKAVQSLK